MVAVVLLLHVLDVHCSYPLRLLQGVPKDLFADCVIVPVEVSVLTGDTGLPHFCIMMLKLHWLSFEWSLPLTVCVRTSQNDETLPLTIAC